MKIITLITLAIILTFCSVETYSKEYENKKKRNYHSIGIGLGIANLTPTMGDQFNSGTLFYGGYSYNRKALIVTGTLSYTSFSEFNDPAAFDYTASVSDVSVLGGIYWNILQNDFYEGVTPYIGVESGYTIYLYSEESASYKESGGIALVNIAPTIGVTIPIAESLAILIDGKYKLNLLSQGGFGGGTAITGTTDYNYYAVTAGLKLNI